MSSELSKLEQTIGYQFSDKALLGLALTHRSVSKQHNNERLEFLGDSIVNHIIAADLVERFKTATEGQLTRMRANLVCGKTLAVIAKRFNLTDYILVGPGEKKMGGARKESILADAVEAIIAAIYNDADMLTCRKIVLDWYQDLLEQQGLNAVIKDSKTRLQELMQSLNEPLPEYILIKTEGPAHNPMFHIRGQIRAGDINVEVQGASRRKAEQLAATEILNILKNEQESKQ